MNTYKRTRWYKEIDLFMVVILMAICMISLLAVSSATHTLSGGSKPFIIKQGIWALAGFVVMFWLMRIDLRSMIKNIEFYYWGNIVLLIVVFGFHGVNGAHGWIPLPGGFAFEPSEFFKIVFVIMMGKYLANEQEDENGFRPDPRKKNMLLFLYGAFALGLIIIEPELGQSMMILSAVLVALFMHAKPKNFWIGLLIFILIVAGFWLVCFVYPMQFLHFLQGLETKGILKSHQYGRFYSFIYPENDLSGSGYQVYQAKVAIGSGQLFGKGLYQGSQTQGDWVPEQQTDFIFSVIGEELGFVGSVVLVFLYLLMIYRIIANAYKAADRTGVYICSMIAGMFTFQIFENIGMSLQLMPMTGVTLPFISYGGSSLLTNFILIGIALNIGYRRRKLRV